MNLSALLRPLLSRLRGHRIAVLRDQARSNASMALFYSDLARKNAAELAALKQRQRGNTFTNADIRQINWK